MIFPCTRCGCMPPGPPGEHRQSAVCYCPPDELNMWWRDHTLRLRQARDELRRLAREPLGLIA